MRCSGSIVSLNFAMRSWMSSAALTAVTAEPNSASMASPAVPTRRPLAGLDGRTPDLDLRRLQMPEGARLRALHHAGEARDVGMDDGG